MAFAGIDQYRIALQNLLISDPLIEARGVVAADQQGETALWVPGGKRLQGVDRSRRFGQREFDVADLHPFMQE